MKVITLTCQRCSKTWDRPSQGGRRPKFCDECRSDPLHSKKAAAEAKVATKLEANERIDRLERNLRAGGNHLDQKRERRSYSIAELEQRIHDLEEGLRAVQAIIPEHLVERVGSPGPAPVDEASGVVPKRTRVSAKGTATKKVDQGRGRTRART